MRLVWWSVLGLLLASPAAGFDFFGLFGGGSDSSSTKKHKHREETPVDENSAQDYLYKFGYSAPSQLQSSRGGSKLDDIKDSLKAAVKRFQEFAGISPSGQLDIKTRKKMAEPRCGMLDVQPLAISREGANVWKKNLLTYSIFSYSTDISRDEVTKAIRKAFETWATVTNLDFKEVSNRDESADIKIKFASRSHGDPWPFDGRSGVLAHATMPTSGMLHFDEDETWVFMDAERIANNGDTDLFPVAIHEIGHVLGLEHSRTKESIMAPFYQETVDDYGNYVMPKLSSYDIQSIQDLYGRRRGGFRSSGDSGPMPSRTTTTPRPRTTTWRSSSGSGSEDSGGLFGSLWSKWMGGGNSDRDRNRTPGRGSSSDRSDSGADSGFSSGGSSGRSSGGSTGGSSAFGCPAMVDAISPTPQGTVYLFSGAKVFELRGRSIIQVHQLRTLFPRGPLYVEAAYMNKNDRTMVLFQSYKVFAFDYFAGRYSLDLGYPKSLPRSISFNPTGAVTWTDGHQFLFSRSDNFATYDEYWNEVQQESRTTNYFSGLPNGVRGGLPSAGGLLTIFTRDKVTEYDPSRKMAVGRGQSLSSYLNC